MINSRDKVPIRIALIMLSICLFLVVSARASEVEHELYLPNVVVCASDTTAVDSVMLPVVVIYADELMEQIVMLPEVRIHADLN